MKKKVCIFTLYSILGGSSNYRILMYLNDLKKEFDVQAYEFWPDKYLKDYLPNKKKHVIQIIGMYLARTIKRIIQLLFIAPKYDVVIIQKGIIPFLPIPLASYLSRKGVYVIYDVDDAIYLTKGDCSESISKQCNLTIVGNSMLYQHYASYSNSIEVVPTVDHTSEYRPYISYKFENKCIGWIGSAAQIYNLDSMIPIINKLYEKYPNICFKYICDNNHGYENKIRGSKFCKWQLETYKKEMAEFTIGIMPLEDTEFNRGKCGFKLIQYLSLEKPVVASPVGVNEEIVGKNGLVAKTELEWIEAIESLLFDKSQYDSCIKNIKNDFKNKYSYEIVLQKWIDIIKTH